MSNERERERGGGERAGPDVSHGQGFTQALELLGTDMNSSLIPDQSRTDLINHRHLLPFPLDTHTLPDGHSFVSNSFYLFFLSKRMKNAIKNI